MELTKGIIGKKELTVTMDKTAAAVGSGLLDVFATPQMIALMEATASESVAPYLDEGSTSVGTLVNVSHVAATPVGMTVRCESELIEVEGRKAKASIIAVMKEEREAREKAFWESIEEGKTYTGVVKSMTSYGAFVDLGGIDGMVHASELSWKRIKSPAEVLAIGDEITVYVKSFNAEKKRISLGYKTEESNPWYIFTHNYAIGDVVSVKIVSLMPFGAFAEIIDGVDGLIHISQIANRKIGKPADVLEVGQVVDAKIVDVEEEKQRVGLSIRALLQDEEAAVEVVEEVAEEVTDAE